MKAIIYATYPIKKKWLDEIKEEFPITINIETTEHKPIPKWNNLWGWMQLSWTWFKATFNNTGYDVICYAPTREELEEIGVIRLYGMYSIDGTAPHEFWVSAPDRLRSVAKRNGFRSNFAYTFCHELCHGFAHLKKQYDRTHDVVKEGTLKDLIAEHRKDMLRIRLLYLARKLRALLGQLQSSTALHRRLPDPYNKYISQQYGVDNPRYPRTGKHIGVDYATPIGTPVFAPWHGRVTLSGHSDTLGHFCHFEYLHDGRKRVERYCHLREQPTPGEYKRGQIVTYTGRTGAVTGPHFHVDGWLDQVQLEEISASNWDALTYNPHIS